MFKSLSIGSISMDELRWMFTHVQTTAISQEVGGLDEYIFYSN